MIESNNELITSLEGKIDLLVNRYFELKKKSVELEEKNQKLANRQVESEKQIIDLQIRYDNLKLAKTLEVTQEGATEAKLKINQMVREIDKCIALLNR
jgi:hypothetical protein